MAGITNKSRRRHVGWKPWTAAREQDISGAQPGNSLCPSEDSRARPDTGPGARNKEEWGKPEEQRQMNPANYCRRGQGVEGADRCSCPQPGTRGGVHCLHGAARSDLVAPTFIKAQLCSFLRKLVLAFFLCVFFFKLFLLRTTETSVSAEV